MSPDGIDPDLFQGRRRPDTPDGDLPEDMQVGDYWKILSRDGDAPLTCDAPSNLTGQCWHVVVPLGSTSHGLGNLMLHTVREHDDCTISVLPNDGSSNSILVSKSNGDSWHGYVYRGVFDIRQL